MGCVDGGLYLPCCLLAWEYGRMLALVFVQNGGYDGQQSGDNSRGLNAANSQVTTGNRLIKSHQDSVLVKRKKLNRDVIF